MRQHGGLRNVGIDVHALRMVRRVVETIALLAAFFLAYAYRFGFSAFPDERVGQMLTMAVPVVLLQLLALRVAGAHRHSWRYTSLEDVVAIALALIGVSLALTSLRLAVGTPAPEATLWVVALPYGVILGDAVLAFLALSGLRVARRLQSEMTEERHQLATGTKRQRVLLIGAGRAGVMVSKEIVHRPDLGLVPLGYLDDDPAKQDRTVAGLPVLGTTNDLPRLAEEVAPDEVIITMASVGRDDMRRILDLCETAGIRPKIIPGLYEIVGGRVNLSRIRPVAVEDLLGRDQVELDVTSMRDLLAGRTVMVSGAGGSIGAELARQAARFAPSAIVLVEQAEPALWAIHRDLEAEHADLPVVPAIADVCDEHRMRQLFADHRPDVVLHAAAHKHVPIMEDNPGEAIKNNVGGTKIVADLAAEHGTQRFVLVSTDKAVNPTSVMGVTKRLAERYVQHVAASTGRDFVAVRFGNVLASTGSVVPIFRQQVEQGGPVTVTHPDMTRYFMTIPEASQLVLQAGALGQPGEILVLDMGEPVRIVDLAENVIRLSGFEPYTDIDIQFTGVRPGEKLFEELSLNEENATRTRHPKIWIGRTAEPEWDTVEADLAALCSAAHSSTPEEIRALLRWMVPQYTDERAIEPAASSDPVADEPVTGR
jgi:FlaA1/EpsC-like NDP-sugar epimerase